MSSLRASPSVSVCLLAYNHERLLEDAVESVLVQKLATKDARIRAVRTARNLGMAGNANFAVAHGRAPYIALLHHDDLCAPDLLTRWLDVAERHPSVAFVSNAFGFYQSERLDYHPFDERTDGRRALERQLFRQWGCPIRGTALIRRSCWDAVGGIREQFGMLADIDLWMRLAARWDVGYVRKPVIIVRQDWPEDYPEAYHRWSWQRLRLLYDIHALNREEYFHDVPLRRRLEQLKFRVRVSANELYWLAYGVVRRRWDILSTSEEVSNPYELPPVRLARGLLATLAQDRLERA
jgi:GT2 family glycosyltransferase